MANNTFQDVIDEVFNIFVENEQKWDFGLDNVARKAKSVIRRICEWSIWRIFPDPTTWAKQINIPRLPFLERKTPINWKIPANIGTNWASAWDTEIPIVDTTNLLSSGYVVCKGNIIKYTWKTANTLTWVTGLVIDLESGDQVSQTFLISDINVYKPFDLTYFDSGKEFSVVYRSDSDPKPNNYYTILNNETDRFLSLVWVQAGSYWLYYIKKPAEITDYNTEIELPDDCWIDIVSPIVAWEILRKNEEVQLWKEKLDIWYNILIEYADKRNSDINEKVQQIEYWRVSIYTSL